MLAYKSYRELTHAIMEAERSQDLQYKDPKTRRADMWIPVLAWRLEVAYVLAQDY